MTPNIAVIDTMFSRFDMASVAIAELQRKGGVNIIRRTVPGIKDLAIECKLALDGGADIALALGWVGGAEIDKQCSHEASIGIQNAKLATNKHILEAFVFEFEGKDEADLLSIATDRARKHAENAYILVTDPKALTVNAGRGIRQGRNDVGPLKKA
ncbi:MAG: riboflavin synthase [Candidatus Micrarchaeota archaeon]